VTDGDYTEGEHQVMYRIVESICCTPKSENTVKRQKMLDPWKERFQHVSYRNVRKQEYFMYLQ